MTAQLPELSDRAVACLLGGAIGDALGAGIEFDSWSSIARRHGEVGLTGFAEVYGRRGAITDDTQMTMFTAEGLIRASVRQRTKGIAHVPGIVNHAYLRWLWTQGDAGPLRASFGEDAPDGWLSTVPELRSRRAPGNTCLSALSAGGNGSVVSPPNESKGCGGVMRAGPVGLVTTGAAERFQLGCDIAVLTHGHPSGYPPAGYLAAAIGEIVDGAAMSDAFDVAGHILATYPDSDETVHAVEAGRSLGRPGLPLPHEIEQLGGGWTGEEALAIALACVECGPSFSEGVLAAVNHSGDSDSTGSIAGNLLGAMHGRAALPDRWTDELELRAEIEQLARDLVAEMRGHPDGEPDGWRQRYPGW